MSGVDDKQKNIEDLYPLAPMQQGMLFHSLYAPETGVYVGQLSCSLRGKLDREAFGRAWQNVVDRHTILRTGFLAADLKEPVQLVSRQVTVSVEYLDWRCLAEEEQKNRLSNFKDLDRCRGFNLERPPLLRLTLIQTHESLHHFVWTYHHILFDGWSLPRLMREVAAFYEAATAGRDCPLPVAVPFRRYISWLRKQNLSDAERFWRKNLEGFRSPTPLPTARLSSDSSAGTGSKYAEMGIALSASSTARLQAMARRQRITLNTVVQGAWGLLLSRHCDEEVAVFGATVSGRPATLPGAEEMIGLFINTLPIRVSICSGAEVAEWLREIQRNQMDLLQYEFTPLVQIQGWSEVPRGAPLFDTILVFENFPIAASIGDSTWTGEIKVEGIEDVQRTNYPLTLVAYPGEELTLRIGFDTDRFETGNIERILQQLRFLIEQFIERPGVRLADVTLLTCGEREQILANWNDTVRSFREDLHFHSQFEAVVERCPEAEAIGYENEHLTYTEVNKRANRLAHHLRRLGAGPETFVGVCLHASPNLVEGILGVLKAGAAYLPLDPTYPRQRIAFMLSDAHPRIIVTQSDLLHILPEVPGQVICLDRDWPEISLESCDNPGIFVSPENPAYMIYTSGSTGVPKGVVIKQRSLTNFISIAIQHFDIKPDCRVLQFASISFDASVSEIVMALAAGAALVLAPREQLMSPSTLIRQLKQERITTVTLPPALLSVLEAPELPSLRTIASAGDICRWDLVDRWGLGRRFLNGYGPTEATVGAAYYQAGHQHRGTTTVPIGGPVANAQIYLLDRNQRLVPVGIAGELCISGAGLARGYHDRPGLTAEMFIPNPFSGIPGSRMYRTGDLGRYLPEGSIEFLGRIDRQVKVRGIRIEVGEIEAALRRHPGIGQAAVVAREDASGDKRLVAYIVPGERIAESGVRAESAIPSVAELRAFLSATLPDAMLPSTFITLQALPLTPNGKIDRNALEAPDSSFPSLGRPYVAPRTPHEEIIAAIWAKVLGLTRVGADDHFFELGGHSLLATQVLTRVQNAFHVELPLRTLFEQATLAAFAAAVEKAQCSFQTLAAPPIVPVARDRDLPLSYAQQRLWFLEQLEPNTPLYNLPAAVRLTGSLHIAAFEKAIREVLRRHEVLRTCFPTVDGKAVQVINPQPSISCSVIDMSAASEEQIARRIQEESQEPFDLAHGPLVRVQIIRLGEHDHIVLLIMHHIVSDGWSIGVLLHELCLLYNAYLRGQESPLPELPIQYADYAAWQRHWLQGSVLEEQIDYWRHRLDGIVPLLALPIDRARPRVQTYHGATLAFEVPAELTTALRDLNRQEGATFFMVLLAAFQSLLHRYSGQKDICVGSPIANRTRVETEKVIGFFVNMLVFRSDFSGRPTFREVLRRTRDTALGAYAHRDVPFEMVVDAVQPERDLSHHPLFQAVFSMQNALSQPVALGDAKLTPFEADSGIAKFDLTMTMSGDGTGLSGMIEYNTELFDSVTIERMTAHFVTLLEEVGKNPDRRISNILLLSPAERSQQLNKWNRSLPSEPETKGVCGLFEQWADRTPQAAAAFFQNNQLTYGELNRRANQLAHHLLDLRIGREKTVAICLEQTLDYLVAILAVLKAGGAYVPMDPSYPVDRLRFILEDAGADVLVTHGNLLGRLPSYQGRLIRLDEDGSTIARFPTANPQTPHEPNGLAYVIYTSGTTGRPKGTLLQHRSLSTFVDKCVRDFRVGPETRFTQFFSFTFDGSIIDTFTALCSGGSICLIPRDVAKSPSDLNQEMRRLQVTHAIITPSMLSALPTDGLRRLQTLLSGGESCTADVAMRWWGERRFINIYGPTEATVAVCWHEVNEPVEPAAKIPIGRPFPGVWLYILDEQLELLPVGATGELYIGGHQLARGYLNHPDLTAEMFLPNPFSAQAGARMYRTGDRVRFRVNGDIEHLGRNDDQVKIRGFRIELGEIESALRRHPGVSDAAAAVISSRAKGREKRLAAYYVPRIGAECTVPELRAFLAAIIPEYAVPSVFVPLDALPVTGSGKVDRQSLPSPEVSRSALGSEFVEPNGPGEIALAEIWKQTLGVERVGIHDNFFELGGDSILSIQVVAKSNQAGIPITAKLFFQNPTIAGLLDAAHDSPPANAEQGEVEGYVPLTPIQHWFLEHHTENPHHWNTSMLVELPEEVDQRWIEPTLGHLMRHHDMLRARFQRTEAGWQQWIAKGEAKVPFHIEDLSEVPPRLQSERIESEAQRWQASLNLISGPLLRVVFFDLGPGRAPRLLMIFHHMIMDGVSWRIFLEDFLSCYGKLHRGEPASFPPKTTSFQHWAHRMSEMAQSASLREEAGFWSAIAGQEIVSLPVDLPGENTYATAQILSSNLSRKDTQRLLHDLPSRFAVEINDILLTALARTHLRWTGRHSFLIELEGQARRCF
jgi:amino acid adenylation domain-containing protein